MYGNVTATGATTLAATGLAVGSQVLAVIGVVFVVVGLVMLLKRDSKNRP